MNAPSLLEQIDAAQAYDSLLVPALFGQWALKVADVADIQVGQRVLDVACGTGILTREVSARVGRFGYVAGLDPNPGMLEVGRQQAPEIDWKQGTAESLPFSDGVFDVVVSQFGLMFFIERPQALREMLRVLAPGGCLVVAVWDGLENILAYAKTVAVLERIAGQQAADALRAPFVLGDVQALSELFSSAGAASIQIETHKGTARFADLATMLEVELRGWLPIMGVMLTESQIKQIHSEAEDTLGEYVSSDGRMVFELSAHIVTVDKASLQK